MVPEQELSELSDEQMDAFAGQVCDEIRFGSNMRAGAAYRKTVCRVLGKTCHAGTERRTRLMDVKITLNGKVVTDSVDADMVLLGLLQKTQMLFRKTRW